MHVYIISLTSLTNIDINKNSNGPNYPRYVIFDQFYLNPLKLSPFTTAGIIGKLASEVVCETRTRDSFLRRIDKIRPRRSSLLNPSLNSANAFLVLVVIKKLFHSEEAIQFTERNDVPSTDLS